MVQDIPPEISAQEAMLQQAIKFIREGKYPEAKDLLTRLLRSDQNNATYWVWMSAAMETQKERLYCLQMAYKMDPANAAARRGLILMGALNPDESLAPFPMNHPRPWESKLKLADEKPKPTGIKRLTGSPLLRLAFIGIVAVAVVGGAIFGLGRFLNNRPVSQLGPVASPRPTVTSLPNANAPTPRATIPPLATLLAGVTYTPTTIYAATPHGDLAGDAYRGAVRAYAKGDWEVVANMMAQVATTQPNSVDAIYFIAEAKRLGGHYADALEYYQDAISINPNFAPIYLGRARTNLAINPKKDVLADLDAAINLDPNYAEAYMERGLYYMRKGDYPSAKRDMEQATTLNPSSPLIQLTLARVLLAAGENEAALAAAQKAKELDVTMLDAYLVIGMAYRANGQIDDAVDVLNIYTEYSPNSAEAFTVLATAYYNRKDYPTALENVNKAIQLDGSSAEAYRWRGEIHLVTDEPDKAVDDFKQAFRYDTSSFDAGLGIGRALIANEDYRNAYIEIISIEKLVKNDSEHVLFLYYRAKALEKIDEPLAAYNDWKALLELPAKAIPDDIRAEAESRRDAIKSPTSPPPTITGTITLTPTATRFPSQTPQASQTPKTSPTTESGSATTATPKPTITPTPKS